MGHGNDVVSEFGIAMAALGRATEGMRMLRFRTAEAECKDAMGQCVDSFFDMEREGDFLGLFHGYSMIFHVCFRILFVYWVIVLLGYCWVIALLGFWDISCFCL